jgi:hypothetical protein
VFAKAKAAALCPPHEPDYKLTARFSSLFHGSTLEPVHFAEKPWLEVLFADLL